MDDAVRMRAAICRLVKLRNTAVVVQHDGNELFQLSFPAIDESHPFVAMMAEGVTAMHLDIEARLALFDSSS